MCHAFTLDRPGNMTNPPHHIIEIFELSQTTQLNKFHNSLQTLQGQDLQICQKS